MENLKEIIIAVIASNAFFGFVQFLITLYFSRKDKTKELEAKIDKVDQKIDLNQAILARTHILRFSDELKNGVEHSQEYFHQQLDDCDVYDDFCYKHPSFKNSYAEKAKKHIMDTYEQLLKDGKL